MVVRSFHSNSDRLEVFAAQYLAGWLPGDELPLVGAVDLLDSREHLALEVLGLLAHPVELSLHRLHDLLEREHPLDAGEVQPEVGRQLLNALQLLDVALRIEARPLGRALRLDQALGLIDPERLRMHAGELGGDRDHEDALVVVEEIRVPIGHRYASRLARASRSVRGFPFITFESSSTACFCSSVSDFGTSI